MASTPPDVEDSLKPAFFQKFTARGFSGSTSTVSRSRSLHCSRYRMSKFRALVPYPQSLQVSSNMARLSEAVFRGRRRYSPRKPIL
jgi:hypothetical protein